MLKKYGPTGFLGLILTLLAGFFFLYFTLGFSFISGNSLFWSAHSGDRVQHLAGLNMYLMSEWQFPLLNFNTLNYPYGGNVAFTDAIPVFAFLLKVFLPKNVGFINPLGYWVALNFILQAFSAWWITRELKVNSWAFLVFLIFAFLTYPVWMQKIIQVALMSHWIILFAIALYIRGFKRKKISFIGWALLLFFSFYIHLYLFAMAFIFYLAANLETKYFLSWKYFFSLIFPVLPLAISLFIFFLPLPPNVKPGGRFDDFAMNLLSPIQGGYFYQLIADFTHTPKGFNYLGLGVLMLVMLVVFLPSTQCRKTFHQHGCLSLLLLGCFIYSLSTHIYFGGKLIAMINYPEFMKPFTSQLRCSGRFFWPIGYILIVFSLYLLYKNLNKTAFTLIASGLLLVQCMDVSDFYARLFVMGKYDSPQPEVSYADFNQALKKQDKYFYLYPKFGCKQINGGVGLAIMRYAAEHQLIFNTGYISRFPSAHCDDMLDAIAHSDKNQSIYVFFKMYYPNINQVISMMGAANYVECRDVDMVYMCHFTGKKE